MERLSWSLKSTFGQSLALGLTLQLARGETRWSRARALAKAAGQGRGKAHEGTSDHWALAALLKVFAQGFAAQVRVSNQGDLAACATSLGATWSPRLGCKNEMIDCSRWRSQTPCGWCRIGKSYFLILTSILNLNLIDINIITMDQKVKHLAPSFQLNLLDISSTTSKHFWLKTNLNTAS